MLNFSFQNVKILTNEKITFFGITQGMMWSFFCSLNGYGLSDWQWWVIVLTGCTIWSIIYHKCKKDD